MTLVTIGYKLTASAGFSDTETIYTVPSAQRFRLKRVVVTAPTGVDGQLSIVLQRGEFIILPREGSIYPGPWVLEFYLDEEFSSGSEVKVTYHNEDTTNPHDCFIYLEGELE